MTEEEHTLSIERSKAIQAKWDIEYYNHMLTDDEIIDLINILITFENSHIIANNFKDDQVAYALYEELKIKFK